MEVYGQRHAQAALPPGKPQYPLYGRLSVPRTLLDGCEKSRPQPGFELRNVEPLASLYTD